MNRQTYESPITRRVTMKRQVWPGHTSGRVTPRGISPTVSLPSLRHTSQFFRFLEAQPLLPIRSELSPPITMASDQTEKGKKPLSSAELRPAIEPVVGVSLVLNQEAMDKVRPMLASSFNELGKTVAWPASCARIDRTAIEVPFFIDALWAGLVPPFSAFFNDVLAHHQIHMLHLDPQSVTLLAIFALFARA